MGDPSTQSDYVETLARQQGWSVEFARHVFDEYRRFLFLATSSTRRLATPAPIQAAWDLHRGLPSWRELPECRDIEKRLDRPGTIDDARVAYVETFGRYPPESIWPQRERPAPTPNRKAGHLALTGLVLGTLGAIWSDLLPGAFITPTLLLVGGIVFTCMRAWHPPDPNRVIRKGADEADDDAVPDSRFSFGGCSGSTGCSDSGSCSDDSACGSCDSGDSNDSACGTDSGCDSCDSSCGDSSSSDD